MRIPILVLPLALAACATAIDAPSLLPREAEKPVATAPAPPPPPADPALAGKLAALTDQAQRGDTAFESTLPRTRSEAVPRSDSWALAQGAVSAADLARGPTLDALRGLDTLVSETLAAEQDVAAVLASRTKVQAIVDRQNAKLAAVTPR